jgi:hypothetical protein
MGNPASWPQRRPRDLPSRRHPRELAHDELEAVFDGREVGAREVDLTQGERLFLGHAPIVRGRGLIDGQRRASAGRRPVYSGETEGGVPLPLAVAHAPV